MSNGKKASVVVDDVVWLEPKSCKSCDWEPPLINNEDQEIAIENTWLVIPIPNSAVFFYVCPKCQAVWANRNAVENVKKLMKARESKILTLNRNRNILPPSGIKLH